MSVKLPILPKELISLLEAVANIIPGKIRSEPYRTALLVPAGYAFSLTVSVPSGWVNIGAEDIKIFSDYYSENIVIDVWVDGYKVNPYPIPLTAQINVNLGVYYVQKQRATIDIYNMSDKDATVTIEGVSYMLDKGLFENFFYPLIKLSYDKLKELAEGGVSEGILL